MKNRIFAFFTVSLLAFSVVGSSLADVKKKKGNTRTNPLVAILPASDAVVALDVKRFFGEALPTVLSANQPMLAKITSKIDEMQIKTGIDIRKFDHIAAGVTFKKIGPKKYDMEPVVAARGNVNMLGLIAAAKLAANGKYRQEHVGSRDVYIFAAKEIAADKHRQLSNKKTNKFIDKAINKLSTEIAATAFDANTLIFGSVPLVRDVLQSQTKVSSDITSLLGRNESSVVDFAARAPEGMSAFLPLANDELGRNIDAIRYVYGDMDIAEGRTNLHVTARTLQNAHAAGLLETLGGLQMLGKVFLGNARSADKQVYARLIDNAKLSAKGNEVSLDLTIPQSDIDVLIGMVK